MGEVGLVHWQKQPQAQQEEHACGERGLRFMCLERLPERRDSCWAGSWEDLPGPFMSVPVGRQA